MKPDFSQIPFGSFTSVRDGVARESWISPEKIEIKPDYSAADIKNRNLAD
ncbi:MAG: hypothetical protein IM603_10435, partial [Cytophagales bacterium]|nr:hypothetical protein [Cytophagales bacterium]